MLFKAAFLLGLIYVVSSECPRKKFCFPKQWQSNLSAVNLTSDGRGTVQITPEVGRIYVDEVDKKVRIDIIIPSGEVTFLALFKEDILYIIFDDKNCTKIKHVKPIKWCTPENANISRPYRLGYKPSISVLDYEYSLLDGKVILSTSGKAPVSIRFFETLTGEFSGWITTFFENYLPIKPNPKVFIVPDICKPHNEKTGDALRILSHKPIWEMMTE